MLFAINTLGKEKTTDDRKSTQSLRTQGIGCSTRTLRTARARTDSSEPSPFDHRRNTTLRIVRALVAPPPSQAPPLAGSRGRSTLSRTSAHRVPRPWRASQCDCSSSAAPPPSSRSRRSAASSPGAFPPEDPPPNRMLGSWAPAQPAGPWEWRVEGAAGVWVVAESRAANRRVIVERALQ